MKKLIAILTIVCLASSIFTIEANPIKKGKAFNPPIVFSSNSLVIVEELSTVINGTSMEYPLFISEINSGLIYYVDYKNANGGIVSREYYFSKLDSSAGEWTAPINIEKEYSKFREENKIMNFDMIYISKDDNLYAVDFSKETYDPQPLNINTKHTEDCPVLSPDGSTLFFTSDRPGSYGGKDIWASERLSNGKWSTPYNLGKTINTAEDEESPFIMADGSTLSFSSKGHFSYGGYDIFNSTQNDEGLWSEPENLGAPINSTSDDNNFITDSQGFNAYYSSDKMEKDNLNIYNVIFNTSK